MADIQAAPTEASTAMANELLLRSFTTGLREPFDLRFKPPYQPFAPFSID